MSSIKTETWTRRIASLVIERGTTRPDWTHVTDVTVERCRFQPVSGEELTEYGRQGVTSRGTLFAPVGTFDARDRAVSPSGVEWEVDGPPRDWKSVTGHLSHQEVPLRRVVG